MRKKRDRPWHTPSDLWARLRPAAREMRRSSTPTEDILWEHLRGRRLYGLRFRRQHSLGPFIADFYCAEKRLIVEVDGGVHATTVERDLERQQLLEARGFKIIHLQNREVLDDMEKALARIGAVLAE